MDKYYIDDIINNKLEEKIIILCRTREECETLINYYVKHYNTDDSEFNEDYYNYPGEMCIDVTSKYRWTYCNLNYAKCSAMKVIPFSQVIFTITNKVRGFESVTKKKNNSEVILPTRGTSKAMAYDFFSPVSALVQPGEIIKIWTDVKAYMQDTECLILNVRSSMGGKFMLANTQGWIDADYYNNEDDEGNIGFFLKNISEEPQVINVGDKIGQGAFFNFLVSDNGNPEEEIKRTGGFGSTGK